MRSHWSLVSFTLLVQSAVGGVWCLQAALFFYDGHVGLFGIKFQVAAFLCVLLAGLAAAMAHLGNPGACFHAVRNIKSSWLSREIFTVNLFAGILAVEAALTVLCPGKMNGWILLPASLAGGVVLYVMTGVYRLRTVPSWNHRGTPLNFLGSALLLGGLLFTLAADLSTVFQASGHSAPAGALFTGIPLIAVLIGFVCKILAAALNPFREKADVARPIETRQPIVQGVGVFLWTLSVLFGADAGFKASFMILALISLMVGEVVQRIRFYDMYYRVGL